jgi:phosphoenolpyruvate carboxykinase (ATP)
LQDHGITVAEIQRNLPSSMLYEHAIRYERTPASLRTARWLPYSGVTTGRSPKDKARRQTRHLRNDIWWGPVNIPLDPHTFAIIRALLRPQM